MTADDRTTAAISAIRTALAGYVFRVRSEAELQSQVVSVLGEKLPGVHLGTEVRDGHARFDIALRFAQTDEPLGHSGLVILELKLKAQSSAVERQAQRYAMMPDVSAVLVVTTSQRLARQLADYPYPTLGGKPFGAIALRTT